MADCRLMAVLGVMLVPASFAYATAQNDAYIAGYAAGVDAADRAKAVRLLAEIPGVNAVKTTETTDQPPMDSSAEEGKATADEAVSAAESIILPTGLLPAGQLFKPLLAEPR